MDLISKTLHKIGKEVTGTFVIQIGAMDGISFDDTRGFLDMYGWDALLVEPIPHVFKKLTENFRDRTNYIFENCAISEIDGKVTMLTLPEGVIEKEGLHPGYGGMSAIYPLKNGFGSDYQRDIDVKNDFGKDIEVNSLSLQSLLNKYRITNFDILICDTEGYDWNIFKQLDLQKYRPKFIRLEYINLTEEEKRLTREKFELNGYQYEISGQDIDAVDKQFLSESNESIIDNHTTSTNIDTDVNNEVKNLIEKYGSDKFLSGYTSTYQRIFSPIKDNVNAVLEIGIGTLDPEIVSSFVGITNLYEHYTPGGSLRAWRDFFPKAKIYGVDVAKDCMFKEDRIETFLFDSSVKDFCEYYLDNLTFDVIIDDGNHDPKYQMKTLSNLFHKLNDGGYYIIEDLGGYPGTESLFVEYLEEFKTFTKEYEVEYLGNHVVIQKVKKKIQVEVEKKDLTVVTGLWNIGRDGRPFTHYIENFKLFLEIPVNMFIYIPAEYEYLVWEKRSRENTFVKTYELEDIKNLYAPFWDKTQKIRTDPAWYNSTGEHGWLAGSPQATLEWYNPIVQSKMFLLNDVTIWNPFNSEYFVWLDAGITNTVPLSYFTEHKVLDKMDEFLDTFLFLSYPYETFTEIHGFDKGKMDAFSRKNVNYVCRGGLFGGRKEFVQQASAEYYNILDISLHLGLMGTEESLFTIMSYNKPDFYRRYALNGNGLISKFTDALANNAVQLCETKLQKIKRTSFQLDKVKTSLYILTFNFPEQLEFTLDTWKKSSMDWLEKPAKKILIDNSTNDEARIRNREIADKYGFEHIIMNENKGICGGRQFAAEHFDASDSDFYLFFEDDMGMHAADDSGFCRNGFRNFVPNLYAKIHKVMLRENFDFLKLSYTEVFMDNQIQVSWYNVPQFVRTEVWPEYDKLPLGGLDPNAPRTKFENIDVIDELSYINGEVYYANWPMIASRAGNRKMFLDTKWEYPFEQTWMSYMFQMQRKGELHAGVLLASPIKHDRILWYKPEERREN